MCTAQAPPRSAACPAHTWTAGTNGLPAHNHLRHRHGVTHLERAVAVHSLLALRYRNDS